MIYEPSININEEAIFTKNKKNPVFIVLSSGHSALANIIKKVTNSEMSHAMISFNSKLDPLYSFGTRPDGHLGFVINTPKSKIWDEEDCKYSVYVMYVTDKAKHAMQSRLSDFVDNEKSLKYSFNGLLRIFRGRESEDDDKWFCSRFVMEIISKAQNLSKVPSLWRPSDISSLENISLVNRGFNFYNYNYKVTERHCKDIKDGNYDPGDVIYEGNSDPYVNYLISGSELFLEDYYKRYYSTQYYKIPEVGYPDNNTDEYNAMKEAAIKAANKYYKFRPSDANKNYPFKFFNLLEISKNEYMSLINNNVSLSHRFKANIYQCNFTDKKKRISVILVAEPGYIYAMYLLLPNNVLYKFNYDGLLYQESSVVSESKDNFATVYFTRNITPESLQKIYHAMNHPLMGKVGIKISTGEKGGHNFLDPNLIKDLVQELNGTIIECNTAYAGSRNTNDAHWQTIKDHGFLNIADVDLMDEDGDIAIPVRAGYHLKKNYVGSHIDRYNTILMLSHFKGHTMAGYGWALKNMSIGMASSKGKNLIHTHGLGGDIMKADKNKFLESMVDADQSIMNYFGRDNILYINVANNLSVDCDCDPNPAKPEIEDIGIFASTDPVALDRACLDAVWNHPNPNRVKLMRRITSRNGQHTIDCAEKKGLGTQKYSIVDIDMIRESSINELSSSVEKDYQSKKDTNLSQYTKIKLTDAIIQVYQYQRSSLSNIKITKDTKGYIWLDDKKVVGYINVEEKDDDYKWIQAFEIYEPYKGHGLSKQMLKIAVTELGATNLSVSKDNEVAIKIYKSFGFKTYKSTDSMYFMSRDKNIEEAYYVKDHMSGRLVQSVFQDADYKITAELAQKQIRKLHMDGKYEFITCKDIELSDGLLTYAEYKIDEDYQIDLLRRFVKLMNIIVNTSQYCGTFLFPDQISKGAVGLLKLQIDTEYLSEEKTIDEKQIKSYKNPALQLRIKNTKKRNDQISKGNYTDATPEVPSPEQNKQS